MAFRFWRRIKVAPGISVNLSKSGGSLSFGPRGSKLTVGPGGKRVSAGIPGTGLFYTQTLKKSDNSANSKKHDSGFADTGAEIHDSDHSTGSNLTLGFFQKLVTPREEKDLIAGCRELILGNEKEALQKFQLASHLADAAYLAGFLALKQNSLSEASRFLRTALDDQQNLGKYFRKYDISATLVLQITEEFSALINPDVQGVLLGLVEIYQLQKRWRDAQACLDKLRQLDPDDILVKLSLSELMMDRLQCQVEDKKAVCTPEKTIYSNILKLTENLQNESAVHAALMLYKARALKELELFEAARDTLTSALRRKKDRPDRILNALRYERALVYEALGNHKRSRSDLEKIFAQTPDYEDVASRLGF